MSSKTTPVQLTQDQIRRDKKQKQKQRSRGGKNNSVRSGYLDGLAIDRIRTQALQMMDLLDSTMVSSAPLAHEILRDVMVRYLQEFSSDSKHDLGPWNRHKSAEKSALAGLDDCLASYAKSCLIRAFRQTNPNRVSV